MLLCIQKTSFIPQFFLHVLDPKKSWNLIDQEQLGAWGFQWKIKNQKNLHFPLFLGKTNDKIFKKLQNTKFSFLLYPYLDKDEFST